MVLRDPYPDPGGQKLPTINGNKHRKKLINFILLHDVLSFRIGSVSDPDSLEMLDPDPDSMSSDPQRWEEGIP
jgi:hypothetical protein